MKHPYDDNRLGPSAMLISVSVGVLDNPPVFSVDAKIDTGADITALPEKLLRDHGIKPEGHADVAGALDTALKSRPTYFVTLQIGGGPLLDVEVVATPRRIGLLGRDVLNDFQLFADGPAEMFELTFGDSAV